MSQQLLERIRDHAVVLDKAAPPIRLADVRARSRQATEHRRNRILVVAAAAALVLGGLVAVYAVRAPDDQPSAVPPPAGSVPLAQSVVGAADQLSVPGAQQTVDELLMVGTTPGAVWKESRSETYLALVVRAGLTTAYPEPSGLGPMRQLEELPAELGQLWVTDSDANEATSPQIVRMWWTRPDDDVWLLTAYWYEPNDPNPTPNRALDAMAGWATSIVATGDPGTPYELDNAAVAGSTMELLFAQPGGEHPSRTQAWQVDGHEVTLLTTEHAAASGLHNLLGAGPPATTAIAGQPAWTVHTSSGGVLAGWSTPGPEETWSALTIPAELAERSSELLASLATSDEPAVATPSTLPDAHEPDQVTGNGYPIELMEACEPGAREWDGQPIAAFEAPDNAELVVCWVDGHVPRSSPLDADGQARASFDRVVFTAARDGEVVEVEMAGYRQDMPVTPP